MKRRILSTFLAVCLLAGLLPGTALAKDAAQLEGVTADGTKIYANTYGYMRTVTPPHAHDNVTFTAWDRTDSLPTDPGNYYLTKDVALDATWRAPSGETRLCLNGKTITMNGDEADAVSVPSGATLHLYDGEDNAGKITHSEHMWGSGVLVEGAFYLHGGSITGNTAYYLLDPMMIPLGGHYGGGVCVNYNGTFTMSGGSITGNDAPTVKGGGVAVLRSGTFTMTGGTISGNKAVCGGGVHLEDSAAFTMTGGAITGNTVDQSGGGVFMFGYIPTFTMSGGSITGNTACFFGGGGVDVDTITLSGAPVITGNTVDEAADNLYLENGETVTIGTGGLTEGASIGVTTQTAPTKTTPVNITGANSADYSQYFISNSADYAAQNSGEGDAQVVQLAVKPAHSHDMSVDCGDTAPVTFTAWTATDSLPTTPGHYYLTENVTLSNRWYGVQTGDDRTIDLCLNGKTVTFAGQTAYAYVRPQSRLNLCDCQESGKITSAARQDTPLQVGGGVATLYGGTIERAATYSSSEFYYHAVDVLEGDFHLMGGTLRANGIPLYVRYNSRAHLSGAPTLTVTAGEFASIRIDGYAGQSHVLYASGENGGTAYTGDTLTIESDNTDIPDGMVIVCGVNGDNQNKFTLQNAGYFLTREGNDLVAHRYAITTQPTDDTPTVAVNCDTGASYSWHPYAETAVDDTVATACVSPMDQTSTAVYDSKTGTWSGVTISSGGMQNFFKIPLKAGDRLKYEIKTGENVTGLHLFDSYQDLDVYDDNSNRDSGVLAVTTDGNYTLRINSSVTGPTIAAAKVVLGEAVEGQTTATLTATATGTYACKVTWPNGTVLVSDPVEVEAPAHSHVWSDDWDFDKDYHWHPCTADGCDLTEGYEMGDWETHSFGEDGIACTVCSYERHAITQQPAAGNDYTVAVNHTDGAAYQWHKVTDTSLTADKVADRLGTYDAETHTWTASVPAGESDDMPTYFTLSMNAGDSLVVSIANGQLGGQFMIVGPQSEESYPQAWTSTPQADETYLLTAPETTTYRFLVDGADTSPAVSVVYRALTPVSDQQIAAKLNTAGLAKGSYLCRVTFADGEGLNSNVVAYTPAHTHSLTKVSGQGATCTQAGWKDYYSCTCGKYYSDAQATQEITDLAAWKAGSGKVDMTAHDFSGAYLSDGAGHWHKCKNCDATDDKANHVYDDAADTDCNTCDYTRTVDPGHTHALTKVDGQGATCTAAGWKDYYSCACGKYFADAAGNTEITDLSAWKAGDGKVDMLAHDFSGAYLSDAAGHWHKCKNCDATDTKADHVYDDDADTTCNTCDYTRIVDPGHTHSLTKVTGQGATCTAAGWKDYYSCACGKYFADAAGNTEITDLSAWKAGDGKVDMTAHDFSGAYLSDAAGHWHKCKNCDATDTKADHTKTWVKTDAAQHWQTCSVCGWESAKANHVYDDDADTTCNDCGHTRTVTPPAPTYSITGAVTENNAAVSGAAVKLMRGKDEIDSATTDSAGNYAFSNVAPGSYNVVATKDGKTMTILVTLTSEDATEQNLVMPTENVNSVLKVEGTDTPDIVVGGLEAEAQENKEENSTVTVTMTVEAKAEGDAPNAPDIKAEAGADKTLEYIEITVEKTVETNGTAADPIAITTTHDLLTVVIPFNFTGKNKDSVTVYRYHDGSVDTLTATPNAENEKIELGEDSITLKVKNFSTYAIGYTETTSEPDPTPTPRPSSGGSTYYTLTATADEGGTIDPNGKISVRSRSNKTFTITPAEGYEIADVLVDGKSVGVVSSYTFEKVTNAHTIEASFKALGADSVCAKDSTCPIAKFTDAKATAWYHDGVHYCLEKGLLVGTSETTFAPAMETSRAMIATILWRLAGSPVVNYAMSYDDVAEGQWYTEAVRWATSVGVVSGYGNGKFGPSDPITREQLATMLYRYEQKINGGGFTGSWMFLLDFVDAADVSQWADEAMHYMTMHKVIEGKGNKTLDPKGQATRAEAATMIYRFLNITAK